MAVDYVPQGKYPRNIYFIPAREYKHNTHPEMAWNDLAEKGFERIKIPVYPRQILTGPFIKDLAKKLKANI